MRTNTLRALFTGAWLVVAVAALAWKSHRTADPAASVMTAPSPPRSGAPASALARAGSEPRPASALPVGTPAAAPNPDRPLRSAGGIPRHSAAMVLASTGSLPAVVYTAPVLSATASASRIAGTPTADSARERGMRFLEAGNFSAALPLLDQAISENPTDPDLHWAAATAATAIGRPQRAATALVALAGLRPLTTDEALWLSGQLQAAGMVDDGLPVLYAQLAPPRLGDPRLSERVGDLEMTQGRSAAASRAYEAAVTSDCSNPALLHKAAGAAAAADRTAVAAGRYAQAAACEPTSRAVLLDAARFHGARHDHAEALHYYERVALLGDTAGLSLELTQAALAAQRPDAALVWAEQGRLAGDDSPALRYAHAQALQLSQRPAEADREFAALQQQSPQDGALLAWRGRSALALGHHLAAYTLFGAALQQNGAPRSELFVGRGDAAAARGDMARATTNYVRASDTLEGEPRAEVQRRLDGLREQRLPEVTFPLEFLGDSSGASVRQAGTQLVFWPAAGARLRAGWTAGRIEQGAYRMDRRAFLVRVDEWFPLAALRIDASAGLEDYRTSNQAVWRVRAQQDLLRGGFIALETVRETPWSNETALTTQRYNRILDLQALGPAFHSTGVRTVAEVPLTRDQTLRVDGGWRQFTDANQQADLYVHYQRELLTRSDGRLWVALQPQVYMEHWRRSEPAYFSPSAHVSAGVGLRAAAHTPRWSFDATAVPQALVTTGQVGMGMLGTATLGRQIGWVWLGGEAMVFEDRRNDYRLRRVTGEIRIPLTR